MRYLLILSLLFFISFYGNAQEVFNKYLNFEIESDNKIAYKKIFQIGNKSKTDIIDFFKINFDIEIKLISDEWIGEIKGIKIDYKKYGGKTMNTMILLNDEMFAKIKIQFREDRYRVILREMKFGEIDKTPLEILRNKKKLEFKKSKTILNSLEYMDKYFADIFIYSIKNDSDW